MCTSAEQGEVVIDLALWQDQVLYWWREFRLLTSVGLEFQIPYDEYVRWLDGCWKFLDFGQTRVVEKLDHVILFEEGFVML